MLPPVLTSHFEYQPFLIQLMRNSIYLFVCGRHLPFLLYFSFSFLVLYLFLLYKYCFPLPFQMRQHLLRLRLRIINKSMLSRFCHQFSDITSDCLNSGTKHYQRQRQRQRQVKSSHLAHLLEPIFGLVCPLSQTKYFPSPHKSFYAISVPFQVSNFVLHFFLCLRPTYSHVFLNLCLI